MHVLIKASDNEYFVIVVNRTWLEELFWFLEGTFHPLDLVSLGVETEAVRYPALVSAKDQDFGIVESKAAHSVPSWPMTFSVYDL